MIDFDEIFNDSYDRIHENPDAFYDAFYKDFTSQSKAIKDMFSQVDLHRQKLMLQDSFAYLISFYTTKRAGDYLINLSKHHKHRLQFDPQMYDVWLNSILNTVKQSDPKYDKNVEVAWRIVLAPGLEFMRYFPE